MLPSKRTVRILLRSGSHGTVSSLKSHIAPYPSMTSSPLSGNSEYCAFSPHLPASFRSSCEKDSVPNPLSVRTHAVPCTGGSANVNIGGTTVLPDVSA